MLARIDGPGWPRDLYLAALGAFSVLAFAPTAWASLLIAGPTTLMYLTRAATPREAARCGFMVGGGLFAVGTAWIWNSLHDIGGVPAPLALLLLGAMVIIMALWVAAACWSAVRVVPFGTARLLLAWPAAWVLVEWARGWVASGFPWLWLGTSQVDTLAGTLLPVTGTLGVSLLVMLACGVFALALSRAWEGRKALALVLVMLALIPLNFRPASSLHWTTPDGAPLAVALVQGNVEQTRKWDAAQVLPTLRLYEQATLAAADADLVVWPEAAIPLLWHQYPESWLAGLADAEGPALVLGALVWDREADRYYNTVAAFEQRPEAAQFYAKQRLVPFGEYFPVPALVRSWLRLMDLPYSDFAAGGTGQATLAVAGVRIGASICYEAAFPAAMMDPLPEAGLLINVSNDAWFGDSIGPHQHFQMARVRAREAGRPLLRATNTGITAVVDADGRVQARLPQFEPGVLRATVQPRSGATPYVRYGDWPVLILCLVMLGVAWRSSTRRTGTT